MIRILQGDCREVMATLPDASVDSIVTDPPYELGFMGKGWDRTGVANDPSMWREALRVLKPGGHLLAFSGTRTYHRMTCAIEDAGFEVRDQIGWLYGSGFPKSKNLDGDWQGWGTALKPAWEPVCVARKPLAGTVAANVLQHGTGALNIDGCRIASSEADKHAINAKHAGMDAAAYERPSGISLNLSVNQMALKPAAAHDLGRWPANVIHDGSDEVLAAFPDVHGAGRARSADEGAHSGKRADGWGNIGSPAMRFGDTGSAARFFYTAKASGEDRNEGLGRDRNTHPTVKPTELMRYLCRLVTPPGGVVLDPFMGSGSTLKAAELEGFSAIGIELQAEYIEIAKRRIAADAPLFADVEAA